MDELKYHIKFSVKDPEGNKFKFKTKQTSYEGEDDVSFLTEQFKYFLRGMGYTELTVSRVQVLENPEWKYVLEKYHEWNSEYQHFYDIWENGADESEISESET